MSHCNRNDRAAVRRESLLAISRAAENRGAECVERAEHVLDAPLSLALERTASVLFALGHALQSAALGDHEKLAELAGLALAWLEDERFVALDGADLAAVVAPFAGSPDPN